jgi:predicted secreted protein
LFPAPDINHCEVRQRDAESEFIYRAISFGGYRHQKLSLIMAGLPVMVLSVFAYAAEPGEVTVAGFIDELMSQKHINHQVEIPAEGLLTVNLGSIPTTGFRWSKTASISDGKVLEQMSHKFMAFSGQLSGAAGKKAWLFRAMKAGTSTVAVAYSRP